MCGIFCSLYPSDSNSSINSDDQLLQQRGPDCQYKYCRQITQHVNAQIQGCVLHLRGLIPVKQPLTSDDDSFLLWNGEIFGGIKVADDANDTLIVFDLLKHCQDDAELVEQISKIHGPWALIYWQASKKKLWFGRDIFGRRSLLWKHLPAPTNTIALTSVASRPNAGTHDQDWAEVPASGIYCLDLSNDDCNYMNHLHLFPWCSSPENPENSQCSKSAPLDTKLLSQRCTRSCIKVNIPITIDFNSALPMPNDLDDVYSGIPKHLEINYEYSDILQKMIDQFEKVLEQAVFKRVNNQPNLCQNCINPTIGEGISAMDLRSIKPDLLTLPCLHSKIAILFSGGLDSTVLCILADRCLPSEHPIDLLNVAFEQQSVGSANAFEVPDRISARESLKELRLLAPARNWNFVEINVTKEEMLKFCEARVADLVYPLETVLDNDIGSAVWFAARGCGTIDLNNETSKYTSPARVVLTGMGADEQLAGYSRHRNCFQRNGWQALIDELKMEIGRISCRNLGRDDRVISDHGREARFPFLDEEVVSYLNSLPIWCKTNLSLPRGIGDKFLLRALANNIGLRIPAMLAKRAIQFGSRVAKMENSRKGTDICLKLKAKAKIGI